MKTTYTGEMVEDAARASGQAPASTGRLVSGMQAASRMMLAVLCRLLAGLGRDASQGAKQRHIKLIETLSLGSRRQLFLVLCDEQRYLVGAGAENIGSITAIGTSSKPAEAALKGPQLVSEKSIEERREITRRPSRRKEIAGPLQTGLELWP